MRISLLSDGTASRQLPARLLAVVPQGAEHELQLVNPRLSLSAATSVMLRVARRESSVTASWRALCDAAMRENGAAAIVLGCTGMAPIGAILQAGCAVPVIESSVVGLRAAIEARRAPPPGSDCPGRVLKTEP
jgi:Asp/Glu/hydantoin racemase